MSDPIWDDPTVTAYILGELPKEEAQVFEARIQEDAELAAVIAEARSVTDRLQAMYTSDAGETLDASRRETITANRVSPRMASDRTTSWRVPLILLATAAALLLLVGAPYLMQQDVTVSSESVNAQSQIEDRTAAEFGDVTLQSPSPTSINSEYKEEMIKMDGADAPFAMDMDMDTEMGMGMGPRTRPLAKNNTEMSQPGSAMKGAATGGMDQISPSGLAEVEVDAMKIAGSPPEQQSSPRRNRGKLFNFDAGQEASTPPRPPSAPLKKSRMQLNAAPTDSEIASPGVTSVQQRQLAIPNMQDVSEQAAQDRDKFQPLTENAFKRVADAPLSTFSADVDTASYSKVREYLLRQRRLPPVDAVRIEELVNYFNYEYLPPTDDAAYPFAAKAEIISCPWNEDHRLARIALKGKTMKPKERPLSNLVFLLDTSGSMNSPNKLPLVKEGMNMLLSQLGENDRVAIVVYAGSAGLVLESTPATKTRKIENALNALAAGGSTNGGQGIDLAYRVARDNFIAGGVNRVILCTDGDFNVGKTGTGPLVRMIEKEAAGNVFLSVLGFGMGNHNDSMLEQISGSGNGNYAFIDTKKEAQKVLVDQANGTLVTIAKDVKLQIEFNPRMVSAYRLIGYENRILAKEDFNDDRKDAGEIGAGHTVTALYELIPAGTQDKAVPPKVDGLKYQTPNRLTDAANQDESLTLKLRYKEPDGNTSKLVEFPVIDNETTFQDADHDARFAAAVASFGMQLRQSKHAGDWSLQDVLNVAEDAKGEDMSGLRTEFVEMVEAANNLKP
ncbi:von Willebrand factor type A domain-containing protein [Rhodopirellula sp.]|nr:von Willebrand factor type A domain-containing protein [Rhodopirellula sp.]